MVDLKNLSLRKALDHLKKKELRPQDLIDASIQAVEEDEKKDKKLNAIVYHNRDLALKSLSEIPDDAPLRGLPIVIKDNMNCAGFPISCASKILQGYVSPYTATFLNYLKRNGAVVYAVANMDEFAFGSSNETSAYGPARNPISRDYVPGGSSGGSAAIVSSGYALCSLGSDTGGSIRQPASFCGVVGLKPTYGRVSRYGMIAFGSSFDQAGPLTKSVEDAAILLKYMAGHDPLDASSSKKNVEDYPAHLNEPIKGKKIALVKSSFDHFVDKEIQNALIGVRAFYEKEGCVVDLVEMDVFYDSLRCYYILAVAEAMSNLARFDSIRYGKRVSNKSIDDVFNESRTRLFGKEVRKRCLLGNFFLQEENYEKYYVAACKKREAISYATLENLKSYDAILTPTASNKVFKIGNKFESANPLDMYLNDIFSVFANISKTPSISVPCAKDSNGLPIGFSLTGRHFDEKTILNLAHVYQINNPIRFNVEESS